MPQYAYRARDSALQEIEGLIEADNDTTAVSRLGSQGIFVFSIIEVGEAEVAKQGWWKKHISPKLLAHATRQLADLIGGGLPLLNALNVLAQQTEHPRLRHVVNGLSRAVRDGRSFSESLTDYPDIFPPLYINMVRAGEVSGGLEAVLNRLADLGEHEAELRSRLINASVYPAIILTLSVLLVGGMMIWVIPTLAEVFAESGNVLPVPTRIVMAVSYGLRHWWWLEALGIIGVVWALRRWRKSPQGKVQFDRLMLALPGIGGLVRRVNVAQFARNLGTMLSQGVPVLQALEVVAQNVGNARIRESVQAMYQMVHNGSSMARAISNTGQFPPFVSNMVAVGEESGKADEALMKVAHAYEREVDQTMKNLMTVLEPLLLVVIGSIVMLVVLAILLPIFQIGLMIE
jgi:type II secretion system protein F